MSHNLALVIYPRAVMNATINHVFGKGACLLTLLLAFRLSVAQVRFVAVKATGMVYCPQDDRIYATAAHDAAGSLGNTVCRINPHTGKIESSVFVGDDPRGIVRTADGKSLYVLTANSKVVRQIDRAKMTAGLSFPVGEGQAARRIAPVPEVADALIVQRYNPSISPSGDNLAVFVKGQSRVNGVPCGSEFALGIDPTRVITSSENSSSDFYFGINALLHTDDGPGFSGGSYLPLIAGGYGLVLGRSGFVIDPEARLSLGRLHVESDELCVDPVRPVVYEIFNDQAPTLRCWDLRTFREAWKVPLPTWDGPHRLSSPIRWGTRGFAYLDGDYVVCGSWNLGKPSNPVDLALTRTGFPKGDVGGKSVSYTLTVKNDSGSPSNGAFVTDTIPGVVEVLSVSASQGAVTYSDHVVRADLGSIPAHGSATVTVKLNVRDRGNGGYTAVVRSYDPDPDTSNNIYPGPEFVPHTKLALGNSQSGSGVESGSLDSSWASLQRQIAGVGDNLSIKIDGQLTIVNHGKTPTRPFLVRFYLQDGPNLVVDWAAFLREVQVPSISPGEKYVITLSVLFSSDTDVVGSYVVANIDPLMANGRPINDGRKIP